MGDRSSIIIRQNWSHDQGIEIYAHWAGVDIVNNLKTAISNAEDRWDDEEYFTRIFIQNILDNISSLDKTSGCGIGITKNYKKSEHDDLEYNPVIVDTTEQKVFVKDVELSFKDIVSTEQESVLNTVQSAMRIPYQAWEEYEKIDRLKDKDEQIAALQNTISILQAKLINVVNLIENYRRRSYADIEGCLDNIEEILLK